MRFSVWPTNQQSLASLLSVARHAEKTGWDGVWVADHLMPSRAPFDRPSVEAWTALTAVATLVPRVRVGTLVSPLTIRQPALLARMTGTLVELAGADRVVLGVGAGWQGNEHAGYGFPFGTAAERLQRLDEGCQVIRSLMGGGPVTFHGRHVRLDGAVLAPPYRVPLLIGVKGPRAMRVAARHADAWNAWSTPDTCAALTTALDAACEAEGRDPRLIRRTTQAVFTLVSQGRPQPPGGALGAMPAVTGDADELLGAVAAYADAGIDEVIVPDFAMGQGGAKLEALDALMSEVVAPWRRATAGDTAPRSR